MLQPEFQKVLEIYKDLSLNQMEHLLNLMSKHIEIPHYQDGVTRSFEVESVCLNGAILQINTDVFANLCIKLNKNNDE